MWQALVEKLLDQKIMMFQCDGGGEFTSHRFVTHLANQGIKQLISCPHTPQQNGMAERKHRHITELGLSMLFDGKVPQQYWVEAFFTSSFLGNLLPSSSLTENKSPYEALYNRKPEYSALRSFGSACYPSLRPYSSNKLDPKSLQCVFVGYNEKYKGYRCLYPPTGRVYINRHVLFDEHKFPFTTTYAHLHQQATPLLSAWHQSFLHKPPLSQNQPSPPNSSASVPATVSESIRVVSSSNINPATENPRATFLFGTLPSVNLSNPLPVLQPSPEISSPTVSESIRPSSPLVTSSSPTTVQFGTLTPVTLQGSATSNEASSTSSTSVPGHSPNLTTRSPENAASAPISTQSHHPMITRSKAGITKPNPRYVLFHVTSTLTEPKTVAAALKHPGWTGAMTEEMVSFDETDTFTLVPYQPDMHILGCRWIFRIKRNADGTVKCLRSRLVVKGYDQEEGIDYLDTYSPVVKSPTIRAILHLATVNNWDIRQLDVKHAFLYGDLTETVYMHQPPGFINKEKPGYVCKLNKAIYGLKQAPRAWFNRFSDFLLNFGFKCSIRDPSLFIYRRNGDIILLLLYVDDIALTGSNKNVISQLLEALNKEFK